MKGITCGVSLPEKLVMEIFSRLPVRTLLRFKCVSKSFCNMITCPEFVKLHLSRSNEQNSGVIFLHSKDSFLASFDFHHPQRPAIQLYHPDIITLQGTKNYAVIVGICNGVVCFWKENEFVLYNPATRASKQIPMPQTNLYRAYLYKDKFIYDCIGDDYKILSVDHHYKCMDPDPMRWGEYYTQRSLYSLKSNSWQTIESSHWGDGVPQCATVFANNCFYWISDSKKGVITSFDLSNRKYGMIPLSPEVNTFNGTPSLGVLKGRVHAMTISLSKGITIWMLKEDHDWILLFRCCLKSMPRAYPRPKPYAYSEDGSKIMVGLEENSNAFVCCDLNSQIITAVDHVLGLPKDAKFFNASPWVETLVPLG